MEKEEVIISTIYQTVLLGAEEIFKKIEQVPWNGKILLGNDEFLKNKKYQKVLLDKIIFFTPGNEIQDIVENVISLFLPYPQDDTDSDQVQIFFRRKSRLGNPVKIFLEIHKSPYRIPFELHLVPYMEHDIFPQKKSGVSIATEETFTYQMLPPEDYLSLAIYEILKDLELIKDLSWYKEVYETLHRESVVGRKVWENLNRLLKEYPIPSLEKRLDTLISYKDYGYMKRRWKSQGKRVQEVYPDWKEVIGLLEVFLTPIFEGVLKDEIFLGDWMPELLRYLD